MRWLEYINPLKHFSHEEYISFWDALFKTTLSGFWPRVLFIVTICLAFWVGVRRQNWLAAKTLLLVAAITAYGAAFLMALGVM